MKVLDYGFVELVSKTGHIGGSVVDAARCSYGSEGDDLGERDRKLIRQPLEEFHRTVSRSSFMRRLSSTPTKVAYELTFSAADSPRWNHSASGCTSNPSFLLQLNATAPIVRIAASGEVASVSISIMMLEYFKTAPLHHPQADPPLNQRQTSYCP